MCLSSKCTPKGIRDIIKTMTFPLTTWKLFRIDYTSIKTLRGIYFETCHHTCKEGTYIDTNKKFINMRGTSTENARYRAGFHTFVKKEDAERSNGFIYDGLNIDNQCDIFKIVVVPITVEKKNVKQVGQNSTGWRSVDSGLAFVVSEFNISKEDYKEAINS